MAHALTKLESALTPQERVFVDTVVRRGDIQAAYVEAGYAHGMPNWKTNAATLARKPAVVAALHVAIGRQLALDAATARRVALELLNDEKVAAKVRADLAVKILRMGGHVEPKQETRDTTGDKSLAELSMGELRERAEALERELSERAKPVISATAVPPADDASDMFE